jgi:hypothetical protein
MKWLGSPLPGRCLSHLFVASPRESENSPDQPLSVSENS